MGTRTYSRRGANGIRIPTALGIRSGRFSQAPTYPDLLDATLPPGEINAVYGDDAVQYVQSFNDVEMRRIEANRRFQQQLYKDQGFDGKPTVIPPNEMDALLRSNAVLTHNGEPVVGMRVVNMIENQTDLFEGNTHHVSRQPGWFGTGTYFGLPLVNQNATFVQRLKKLASQLAIYILPSPEYEGTRPQSAPRPSQRNPASFMTALRADARTNFDEIISSGDENVISESFAKWVKGIEKRFAKKYGRSSDDLGTMAAALGYDAIYIPYPGVPGSQNELLVFNRSKMIVTPLGKTNADTFYNLVGNTEDAISRMFTR